MINVDTSSFRVLEDDIKNFKGFVEANNLNQAEMVTALVNAFDITRIKGQLFNRSKEDKRNFLYELVDYENSFI